MAVQIDVRHVSGGEKGNARRCARPLSRSRGLHSCLVGVESGTSVPMLEQLHALAINEHFQLFVLAVAAIQTADRGAHRDPTK